MIGRANIIDGDPDKVEAGIAFVRDRVTPSIETSPGSRGLGMWVDRDKGLTVVTTVWEDRAALDASEETAAPLRSEAARLLGATNVRVRVVEPGVMWQAAPDQPGYWSRFVEMEMSPERVPDAIALFRDEALPKIQQMPGINTVVFLTNAEAGLTVLNVTFRSKADLDNSREGGNAMRAAVVQRLGANEPKIMELETVIAGIRGPAIVGQTQSADRPATV